VKVEGALEKISEICRSLPETTRGTHGGKASFYVRGKLFLTFGGKRREIGVGLEPARAAALVGKDPRFRPYPRDRRAVMLDVADAKSWKEVEKLIVQSYELVAPKRAPKKAAKKSTPKARPVKLLSGGNPQIAKGDGDAPVQAYIAAMPGWKREVGRKLDALIERSVPNVRKAVKWNSPFYGLDGQGFFMGFHTFTHYVKVTFFRGTSLRPVPPGASKIEGTRYLDIREGDKIEEAQVAGWVKQAAALPGWVPGRPS
jgi:hypothetical protein